MLEGVAHNPLLSWFSPIDWLLVYDTTNILQWAPLCDQYVQRDLTWCGPQTWGYTDHVFFFLVILIGSNWANNFTMCAISNIVSWWLGRAESARFFWRKSEGNCGCSSIFLLVCHVSGWGGLGWGAILRAWGVGEWRPLALELMWCYVIDKVSWGGEGVW